MSEPTDDQIIVATAGWGNQAPTYVIKNRLQSAGFKVQTPWVLRQMKRLEREGRVIRVPSGYAVMLSWRVNSPDGGPKRA